MSDIVLGGSPRFAAVKPVERVRQGWRAFRESLLFIPTWMILGALALAGLTSYLDTRYQSALVDVTEPLNDAASLLVFAGGPQSAGRLLAAIAGTWATIAGVVYSVTLVTIQLSATKYSAQVIPIFERDRLNQVVLGLFTGTFAFALLVLKTVREANGAEFVPVLGVNVAILLALVSLGFLIAFIGNLTAYIRPTNFVEGYAMRGVQRLRRQPAPVEGVEPAPHTTWDRAGRSAVVAATIAGYVGEVHWPRLRQALRDLPDEATGIELLPPVGDRVTPGDPLARVWGVDQLPAEMEERLRRIVNVGTSREEDPVHVAETLADVGETALSGGSTDVGLATTALRELVRYTSAAVESPERPSLLRVELGERETMLFLLRDHYYQVGLRSLGRIMDKARREGFWEIGETFCVHAPLFLRRAASSERRETWTDVLEWVSSATRGMLETEHEPARLRMAKSLRRAVDELRSAGLHAQAHELEHVLVEAARDARDATVLSELARA